MNSSTLSRVPSADDDFPSNTFKTEVSIKTKETNFITPSPAPLNVIALRETFLAEAPFINLSNRLFWRKWIDSKEYVEILTSSYKFVQSCVTETGIVNLDKMNEISDSPHILNMSANLADMFFLQNPRDRDIFLNRLPELLCFMITNALGNNLAKHVMLQRSIKFRELLLDWLTELISGIRLTDIHRNREWIFADASDISIVTMRTNSSHLKSSSKLSAISNHKEGLVNLASAQSTFTMGHSSLINRYLCANSHTEVQSQIYPCTHAVRLTLCHIPDRPLTKLFGYDIPLKSVRKKLITNDEVVITVKEGKSVRHSLMKQYRGAKSEYVKDKRQLRDALKTNLAVLENKPVSNKKLIHAVNAMSSHDSITGRHQSPPHNRAVGLTAANTSIELPMGGSRSTVT